jgi:hypothetical protein
MPRKKKRRKVGASGPVAGYARAVERANVDRISPDRVRHLIAPYRASCPLAANALHDGLLWLVYEAAGDYWRRCDEWTPAIYIGFRTALDRLRFPDARCSDVEQFIRAELRRAIRDHYRECSRNIHPPSSSKSDAKRRGDPDPTLHRKATIIVRGRPVDPFDNNGYVTREPEDLEVKDMTTLCARLTDGATPLEQNVLGMLAAGMSERDIARSLRISRHQVRQLIAIIRARAA